MEYRSLGTITIRQYFQQIREGECVPLSEIKNDTCMGYNLLNFHINKMVKEGIVRKERKGKKIVICKSSGTE
jgi:predicted transcriptional regulator